MTSVVLASEESLGYKAVLLNLESIITTLKVNRPARNALILKCQAKQWFDFAEDPSPEELMKVVLNRIEQDGTQYVVFMEMLGGITGLNFVKDRISKTLQELIHKQGVAVIHIPIELVIETYIYGGTISTGSPL